MLETQDRLKELSVFLAEQQSKLEEVRCALENHDDLIVTTFASIRRTIRKFITKITGKQSEVQRLRTPGKGLQTARGDGAIHSASTALAAIACALHQDGIVTNFGDLRIKCAQLIVEEVSELLEGIAECDEIKTLDALADCEFVIHGIATRLDLPLAQAFIEVCNSNLSKSLDHRMPGGDKAKGKGDEYQAPILGPILHEYRLLQALPHKLQLEAGRYFCANCGKSHGEICSELDKYGRSKCEYTKATK